MNTKFGIKGKQRSLVYSGRGRPPKGTFIPPGEGGGDSSDEEEGPRQSAAAEKTELEDKDKEYSEEETDEEVTIKTPLSQSSSPVEPPTPP